MRNTRIPPRVGPPIIRILNNRRISLFGNSKLRRRTFNVIIGRRIFYFQPIVRQRTLPGPDQRFIDLGITRYDDRCNCGRVKPSVATYERHKPGELFRLALFTFRPRGRDELRVSTVSSIVGCLTENWPDRGHRPAKIGATPSSQTHRPMAADVVSTGAPSPRTLLTLDLSPTVRLIGPRECARGPGCRLARHCPACEIGHSRQFLEANRLQGGPTDSGSV
jgi:hypothetical protein